MRLRMRSAIGLDVMLLVLGSSHAAYLEDGVEYADNRFIVKLYPNVGDLDPVRENSTVRVFDPVLTELNKTWNVTRVERLFVGSDSKESEEFDLPGYWRFW